MGEGVEMKNIEMDMFIVPNRAGYTKNFIFGAEARTG